MHGVEGRRRRGEEGLLGGQKEGSKKESRSGSRGKKKESCVEEPEAAVFGACLGAS